MYKLVDGYVRDTFEIVKDKGKKTLRDLAEGVDKDMKFNVVIGNPPYNRGMDLDFVKLGFDLCTDYCVMITPAKWQTAADDYKGCASKTIDYKGFREQLVPHMSKVVFYPDCKDVFNIRQTDGITYFILSRDKHNQCNIINKCKLVDVFNNERNRSILNRETLNNWGSDIINHLGNYTNWKFPRLAGAKKYKVVCNMLMATTKSDSSAIVSVGERKTVVIAPPKIVDGKYKEEQGVQAIFESDSLDECKSFVSWLNTKFTRFFVLINISKLGSILTDDYFRFVPAPPSGKFDHIYTDEELYKAFNLPQEYIDVIEAVIKER